MRMTRKQDRDAAPPSGAMSGYKRVSEEVRASRLHADMMGQKLERCQDLRVSKGKDAKSTVSYGAFSRNGAPMPSERFPAAFASQRSYQSS